MRVVIVGPGRIGCGYLAPLFAAAGWDVVLAARTPETAARIAEAGSFAAEVTGMDPARNGGAVHREDVPVAAAVAVGTPALGEALAHADLVCTAVGVGNVPALAEPLAGALAARPRGRPLDVWVVENGDCAPRLAGAVRNAAGSELPGVGFAGAVATVAVAHGSWRERDRPTFVGDAARRLYVDAAPLRTDVPLPPGVESTGSYEARLREKLYVFNAGHAICAYLGRLRRHGTIAEAVADPLLRPMVIGCLLESRRAVLAAHPELGSSVEPEAAAALRRLAARELADPVVRVARDPIRKLAPGDRLLGPAELVRGATGRIPPYFALAVAGALLYRDDRDPQARELARLLRREGVMAVLERVCGLAPDDPFAGAVADRYRNFVFDVEETVFPPVHAPVRAATPELVAGAR